MNKIPKQKSNSISVYIVEKDELNRTGFRLIFETDSSLTVVGESDNFSNAMSEIGQLDPDVLLFHIDNQARDARFVRSLKESNPGIQVLILFDSLDLTSMGMFIGALASGFCSRTSNVENLLAAVHAIAAGGLWFSPVAAPVVIEKLAEPIAPSAPTKKSVINNLTLREKEILKRVIRGATNKVIAEDLQLSIETVKTYIRRIMDKSSIRNRRELIVQYRHISGPREPGGKLVSRNAPARKADFTLFE